MTALTSGNVNSVFSLMGSNSSHQLCGVDFVAVMNNALNNSRHISAAVFSIINAIMGIISGIIISIIIISSNLIRQTA